MANEEHLNILKEGVAAWAHWRGRNSAIKPDLSDAFLGMFDALDEAGVANSQPRATRHVRAELSGAKLGDANLSGANLSGANLRSADLHDADLHSVNLFRANLHDANLHGANLRAANLFGANVSQADLSGADLGGADLNGANLGDADLGGADLSHADCRNANLTGADFRGAKLAGAEFFGANLRKANLAGVDLETIDLGGTDLSGANLGGANLCRADLGRTNLKGADLRRANLSGADLSGAVLDQTNFVEANLSDTNVSSVNWDRKLMRGYYRGVRGLGSCYGNALFKRDAADQDFLDTLEDKWSGTWRIAMFWLWGLLDYGRALSRVAAFGFGVATFFGAIYAIWPGVLNYSQSAQTWFTPFYFSIVTLTTLGFGDVKPQNLAGELLVCSEVIIGYITLGLLLSVLAEKLARRG